MMWFMQDSFVFAGIPLKWLQNFANFSSATVNLKLRDTTITSTEANNLSTNYLGGLSFSGRGWFKNCFYFTCIFAPATCTCLLCIHTSTVHGVPACMPVCARANGYVYLLPDGCLPALLSPHSVCVWLLTVWTVMCDRSHFRDPIITSA